jgi:hypothetical protein
MTFNQKNNAVHVNLLKLALGLKTDPETARLMRASTRARVDAMAARIQPLLHAADDNAGLAVLSRTAALAAVRARDALKMMHTAVQFQYPVLPEALTALGRLRLGETPQENLTRLQALLAAVRTLPNFMYPPGMTAGGVTAVASEHAQAQAALAAAKFRVSSAAQELRELRPAVKSLWKDLALAEWIKSNVEGHDAQLAFGLSRKKRRKVAGDGTRVEPVTPVVKDVATAVVTEVVHANTPRPVVEVPAMTMPKANSRVLSNGANGHEMAGLELHSSGRRVNLLAARYAGRDMGVDVRAGIRLRACAPTKNATPLSWPRRTG